MFKFMDGVQGIHIGQMVYLYEGNRRSSGQDVVIQKIGRDLITVGYPSGREIAQFYMVTGKQKTVYAGSVLWSSQAAYMEAMKRDEAVNKVYTLIDRRFSHKISYEQAVKILAILQES